MTKEEFLETIPENNSEWVSQQLLLNCNESEIWAFQETFKDLQKVLFKSWAKQMPFDELQEAIARAAILANK